MFEKIPVQPATDRPTKPIRLVDVSIFKDPYEVYKANLAKKLEKDRVARSGAGEKARLKQEKEKDRTTWFGTTLGEKGEEISLDGLGPVGKHLGKRKEAAPVKAVEEQEIGGAAKRKKKAGGFGDFSAW